MVSLVIELVYCFSIINLSFPPFHVLYKHRSSWFQCWIYVTPTMSMSGCSKHLAGHGLFVLRENALVTDLLTIVASMYYVLALVCFHLCLDFCMYILYKWSACISTSIPITIIDWISSILIHVCLGLYFHWHLNCFQCSLVLL